MKSEQWLLREPWFLPGLGIVGLIGAIAFASNMKSSLEKEVKTDNKLEIVRVCKAPLFRRPTEFIAKDQTGQFYFVIHGKLPVRMANDADWKQICHHN